MPLGEATTGHWPSAVVALRECQVRFFADAACARWQCFTAVLLTVVVLVMTPQNILKTNDLHLTTAFERDWKAPSGEPQANPVFPAGLGDGLGGLQRPYLSK